MIKFILIMLLLTSSILHSQNDSVYKFNIPEINIRQFEDSKLVTYRFENDDNLFLLTDSLLSADPDKYKYSVKLNDVKSFSIRNGFSTFGGAKYGGFIGGGLGLIFGIMNAVIFRPNFAEIALSIPGLGAIGFVGGAFIGGILGSAIPYFEEYSKFSDDTHAKREILKRIFKKHNLR